MCPPTRSLHFFFLPQLLTKSLKEKADSLFRESAFRSCLLGWARWIRTIGMTESKSVALPLGDSPAYKNGKPQDLPFSLWGGRWDSNPRQPEPQSGALPLNYTHHKMVRPKGLEPLAHCLEGSCSIHLSYGRI